MTTKLQTQIETLDRTNPEVDLILSEASRIGASDVHFEPTHTALEVRFRLDDVLQKSP